MSVLADRLRGIVAAIPATGRTPAALRPQHDGFDAGESLDPTSARAAAAEVLDGCWMDVAGRQVLVVDRVYRPGYRHGRLTLADHVLPGHGRWSRPFLSGRAATNEEGPARPDAGAAHRALFVDLETTGLAGGAGTFAFLVGCGWFEGCALRIRQLFMSGVSTEPAMLDLLADVARTADLVVSFNGKSFDLPLIETRYLFHRRSTPFASLPHLDLLHPARRLWRSGPDERTEEGGGSCRLSALEEAICGHVREGDVPGSEIPSRYFHYVRTGDARPLAPVFEHNRVDLLSLAFLTARAAQLAEDGVPLLRTAREAVGLGALFERAGEAARARQCLARAAGLDDLTPLPGDESCRAEALHAYAALCRRERRFAEAARVWRQLLDLHRCPPRLAREASEALAVYHEHRLRDPRTAKTFALRSAPLQETTTRRQALQHRLARLDRKLVAQPLSLF